MPDPSVLQGTQSVERQASTASLAWGGTVEAPEFNVDAGSSMVVAVLSGTSMRVGWEDE